MKLTMLLLCGVLFGACKKTATEPSTNPSTTTPVASSELGKLVERLQFDLGVKKDGPVPGAPAGSTLKRSFQDTLYLVDHVKIPIEFLHIDTTKNVAGLYISYTSASFYLDVPEVKDAKPNDTVSTFLVGFDPKGLSLPLSFAITITPYDKTGKALDKITVPLKIEPSNDNPDKAGLCGMQLSSGDYWNWSMSYVMGEHEYSFMNFPKKIHGAGGQFITGCCKDGKSFYNINCSGDTALHRTLHFPTWFAFPEESFRFASNGSFDRSTIQHHMLPDPTKSNFCGSGKGFVEFSANITLYVGKWTIRKGPIPIDLNFYYTTRNYLTLQTTSSSGGGYGNQGGIIHYISCRLLILIQTDNEGGGRHLYKIYKRKSTNNPGWFPMT